MSRFILSIGILFLVGVSHAAGFLDHKDGKPYLWRSFPITYRVDPGDLGTLSHSDAFDLLAEALANWQAVPIANVSFIQGNDLSEDVTEANADSYVMIDDIGAPRSANAETNIIFDTDGSIFDSLFGAGSSSNLLGLASASGFDDSTMSVTTGVALMNGKDVSSTEIQGIMIHEFGHMLNLAHTQIGTAYALNTDTSDDIYVPTMFPFLLKDPFAMLSLNPDDEFSVGYLYPSAAYDLRGRIAGKVLRRNGEGVRGVNVVCRSAANSNFEVVSWISDIHLLGAGEYVCGNLSTAPYRVEIEPIQSAINEFDPYPPFIATEYYSGANESFDPKVDPLGSQSGVAVAQGEVASGIDVILNEDGRIRSGVEVTGTSFSYFPVLPYFITVPIGAKSMTAELKVTEGNGDLDLVGRCDSEFSLAPTVPTVLSSSGGEDQAEFSAATSGERETVTLDEGTIPPLQACTYHILVLNNSSGSNTDFSLTVTVEGGDPELHVKEGSFATVSEGSGEILVAGRTISAREETFRLYGLLFHDRGTGDLSLVSGAKLYEDLDGDGAFSAADRLVTAAGQIDSAAREVSFSDIDEFVEEGNQRTYLVTYEATGSTAGWSLLAAMMLTGILFSKRSRRGLPLIALAGVFMFGSCSSSMEGYRPAIDERADVSAEGQTYGKKFRTVVDGERFHSVKDYFN